MTMQSLSKADIARRDRIAAELEKAYDRLRDAFGPLQEAVATYNAVIDAYNTVADEARGWVDDMKNAVDAYISDKSEKWQDGEKGQAFTEWMNAFDQDEIADIDHVTVDEDEPADDHQNHDNLTGLSETPEGV